MNTNIDDYSNEDIIALLQINVSQSYNEELIRDRVKNVLAQLAGEGEGEDEDGDGDGTVGRSGDGGDLELMDFFRKCYLRLSVVRNFPVTEGIRKELGLDGMVRKGGRLVENESKDVYENRLHPHMDATRTYYDDAEMDGQTRTDLEMTRGYPPEGGVRGTQFPEYNPDFARQRGQTQMQMSRVYGDGMLYPPSEKGVRGMYPPEGGVRGTQFPEYTLILSSKFRVNTNNYNYSRTQSDRIRLKTLALTSHYGGGTSGKGGGASVGANAVLCKKITTVGACVGGVGGSGGVSGSGGVGGSGGNAGTVTDFSVELTTPYRDVVALRVAAMSFDNFYYPVSEYLGTNMFALTVFRYDTTAPDPAASVTAQYSGMIVIDDGYYGVADMVAMLKTKISVLAAGVHPSFGAVDVSYNALKNKIVFRVDEAGAGVPPLSNGDAYGFNIYFSAGSGSGWSSCVNNSLGDFTNYNASNPNRPLYMNLGWMLGYREGSYNFFTTYNTVATPLMMVGFNPEGCVSLNGTSNFFLEIDDYNNNHPRVVDYNCNTNNSYNFNNLISRIPNTTSTTTPFTTLMYEDDTNRIFKTRKYFGPVSLNKLRIRLLDDNGVPVNINEGAFVITLGVIVGNPSHTRD